MEVGETSFVQASLNSHHLLFQAQSDAVQESAKKAAAGLAGVLIENPATAVFCLPARVWVGGQPAALPAGLCEQEVRRGREPEILAVVDQRLFELEQARRREISVAARLVRYVTACRLVYDMAPSEPALAFSSQALAVGAGRGDWDAGRPQPQREAFGGEPLFGCTPQEAEERLASLQRRLHILDLALVLAPYMAADEEYQHKRAALAGQAACLGHAYALYQAGELIRKLRRRAEAGELNRGLSLSVPYLDDQRLEVKYRDVQVIPPGRVTFVPAFLVQAARQEQRRIMQDASLTHWTRVHLLDELEALKCAFDPA